MDTRRAALVAAFVCPLVVGAAMLAAVPATNGAAIDGASVARATTLPAANVTSLACPPRAGETNTSGADTADEPRIAGLYPNPTTDENVGEFVALETPPDTRLGNLTLTDGHTTARLPNETVSGRIALSMAPDVTATLTDVPVRELEGRLRLAADGDALRLRNATATVDSVSYDRAPTAEQWYRTTSTDGEANRGNDGRWWPRDATCLPVSTAAVDDATAFVLPDGPGVPRETIRTAEDRLLLAGYTVTSEAIAADLVAAADRGVEVAVLLEASPVGGTPAATEGVLETLADGGVEVRVIGGEDSRYRYHHPKYAVADDRLLVTTENWKPSGVGGESNRGWGIRLESEPLAADLATVFHADFAGRDTTVGAAYRRNTTFTDDGPVYSSSAPEYPTTHEPTPVPVESAELLLAPDNADARLTAMLENANEEILVLQPSIADDVSLLEATLEAARRGVEVRILVGSARYNAAENEALAADLEQIADRENLPLEVRLVGDTDRFEKIHAKGIVIDGETAVVGSANWNSNSLENNREVLVALHGEAVADYYATVFESDWAGDSWSFPIGAGVAVAVALAVAAVVGRRYVRFGDESAVENESAVDPVTPDANDED
ncbi:phospholipase D-like domain-containing protein [Natrinema thermotolerans]|uniref:Phospholipase D-like domain-containing protein n=1 Tax=Natrinema thermotolerans TaxID=121872 RepID=A0AAF0T6W2_9EURY|nr:phospholipase D-like domain-containing protein [Natrinema thermotolerans]QCC57809.1 phospholipase [Natrinema thermotolerans]WMT08899.1 phospholipase D-like domain-containing protein [Natrinema thermotolerans]